MSSYIPTTTAQATRNADVLTYKGDDGNLGGVGSELRGTVVCDVLLGDYNNVVSKCAVSLSDGGAGGDRMNFYAAIAAGDVGYIETNAAVGNAGAVIGTTDIADGTIHSVRTTWQVDNENLYIDGTSEGTPDTDCGIPDDLDQIDIGMHQGNILQLNGVISDVKIYRKPILK